MNYATVEDIELRWKRLTDSEKEQAEALIKEATSKIRAQATRECKNFDVIYTDDEDIAEITKGLVCNAVKAVMSMRTDALGVSQITQSVGGYSESLSFASPASGIRISKKDFRSIGLCTQKYGGIDLYGVDRNHWGDCITCRRDDHRH